MIRHVTLTFLLTIIKLYRILISPILGYHCRYAPSCSEYATEALHTHGIIKGSIFTLKRLLRCHPWGGSGYDPVPPMQQKTATEQSLSTEKSNAE